MKNRVAIALAAVFAFTLLTGAAMAGRGPGNGQGNGQGNCPYGGGGPNGPACPYGSVQIDGVVAAVPAGDSFQLDTEDGLVTVVVTDETIIKMGRQQIALADIDAGMTVRASGDFQNGEFLAGMVTVRYRGR